MTSKADHRGDDDYDDTPLQHQRPFGSGLHKKAIAFVPASDTEGQLKSVQDTSPAATKPQQDVADLYLSMVLKRPEDRSTTTQQPTTPPPDRPNDSISIPIEEAELCPVCNLPLTSSTPTEEGGAGPTPTPHEQSLAHQASLPHSHPPSALDRRRMGLAYLSARGWDPDARRGLGAAGQGIQFPLKARRVKEDRLGLGLQTTRMTQRTPLPDGNKGQGRPSSRDEKKNQPQLLLDAKKVRKMAREDRRRAERVREELFGDGRLEKYLGSAG